jgi:hypothetical protein
MLCLYQTFLNLIYIYIYIFCMGVLDNLSICYLIFREKHGLVRNDFLDCMMELRKRGEDEAEEDMQSAENVKKGPTFRKLQPDVVISKSRLTFYCDCVVLCGPYLSRIPARNHWVYYRRTFIFGAQYIYIYIYIYI